MRTPDISDSKPAQSSQESSTPKSNYLELSEVPCPICKKKLLAPLFILQQKFPVCRCKGCKFETLWPQPTNQDLAAIYSEDYYLLDRSEEGIRAFISLKESTANHYIDLLEHYSNGNKGSLLEIGCGEGDFSKVAADRGYRICAVEYNKNAVAVAQKKVGHRGTILHGELSALGSAKEEFDICVLSDVIEHVREPRDFLLNLRTLLKPNGIVFIACPSLASWSAKIQGKSWVEYKPEHIHYFSPPTLKSLMIECGFVELQQYAGIKTLSIDYIARHFEKFPVPYFTTISKWTTRLIPQFLLQKPIKIVASGMIVLGRKGTES